jgi:hypothetical protein
MPARPIIEYKTAPSRGRISEFRPEYTAIIADMVARGEKKSVIARRMRIPHSTLNHWMKVQPDLVEALSDQTMTERRQLQEVHTAALMAKRPEYSQDGLRTMANDLLHELLWRMKQDVHAYKPFEIIAAAREALDRTEGKAVQTQHVTAAVKVTQDQLASMPPLEAYKLVMGGAYSIEGGGGGWGGDTVERQESQSEIVKGQQTFPTPPPLLPEAPPYAR